MWAMFLPLLFLAFFPLAMLSSQFDGMDMERPVMENAEAAQFTEYAFAVGKKMKDAPGDTSSWANDDLPLPEAWVCSPCPWSNQRDADTGYRYAYGVPRKPRDAATGFLGPLGGSPSFGMKKDGVFIGGLALGGITPPDWIPEGAYVFAVKQQPHAR